MTREEKIKWFIEGFSSIGEHYTHTEVESWTDEYLDKQCEWLDYLLDK